MTLDELARRGTWEVDLVESPGGDVRIVLVIDADDGTLRAAAPVSDLAEVGRVVARAATDPGGGRPHRPLAILCRGAARAALVEVARALGATIHVSDRLPLADQVSAALLAHLAGPGPLLPQDAAPWREVSATALREAPWRALPDSVLFRFVGSAELQDAVGVVLGNAGEQLGFSIFPTRRDYDIFRRVGVGDRLGGWSCWCAHFDAQEDLPPAHVDRARALGLVHGRHVLQAFLAVSDGFRPLEPTDERACLAAVQGILGAWGRHAATLQRSPTVTSVTTTAGTLEVHTTPAQVPSRPMLDVEHLAVLTELSQQGVVRRTLVIKLAKRDAERLAGLVDGVDALSFEPGPDGDLDVVAWAGSARRGVLTRTHDDPAVRDLRGVGLLAISAGGPRRRQLRSEDLILVERITFLPAGQDPRAPRDDGMFRPTWRQSADYQGPPETWPKASTVLLDFAQPLGVRPDMSVEELEAAVGLASTVWSAVVFADEAGDARHLDALRRQLAGNPPLAALIEQLIERKRSNFAEDKRLMLVQGVTVTGGRADVNVGWRLP